MDHTSIRVRATFRLLMVVNIFVVEQKSAQNPSAAFLGTPISGYLAGGLKWLWCEAGTDSAAAST
jgi:hypothetical protein